MEKTFYSRTEISNDVLMLMAKVSALTKKLNSLTLVCLSPLATMFG